MATDMLGAKQARVRFNEEGLRVRSQPFQDKMYPGGLQGPSLAEPADESHTEAAEPNGGR